MTTVPLRITIDHLLVDGDGHVDPEALRRAIHAELERLAAAEPPGRRPANGSHAIDHVAVRAGEPLDQPGTAALHVGRSIWNSLPVRSSTDQDGARRIS